MNLIGLFRSRKKCADASTDEVSGEENIPHVLLIRYSSMGDVVLVSGVLPALLDAWPEAHIHLITDERYAGFYKDDTRIHRIHAVTKKTRRRTFKELSGRNWDYILDLQNNRNSRKYRQKYFGEIRSGALDKLHGKRLLLLFMRNNRYDPAQNIVARYIQAAGLKAPADHNKLPAVRLTFRRGRQERGFESGLRGKKKLALFPFSAWKNKQWLREYYVEVGRWALGRNWNVLIFGGPTDQPAADRMALDLGTGADSYAGRRTLHEIGVMLTECDLALGNDTGLSHLARACGVPTGIVFGSTTRHWGFYPYGDPPYQVFETQLFCRPCHAHGGNICLRNSRVCLIRVSPATVISGLERLFEESSRGEAVSEKIEDETVSPADSSSEY